MGKIFIKQAPAVQQFQNVSGAPSFGELARRAFAPRNQGGPQKDNTGNYVGTPTMGQRFGAGLGLVGKVGALGATAMQTAHSLQGGNIGAAFNAPLTYQGLDPTGTTNLGQSELAVQQGPTLPANYGQEVTAAQNPSPALVNIQGKQGNINPATGEAISVPLPTQPSTLPPGSLGTLPTSKPQTTPAAPPVPAQASPRQLPPEKMGEILPSVNQAPPVPANPNLITSYTTNPAAPAPTQAPTNQTQLPIPESGSMNFRQDGQKVNLPPNHPSVVAERKRQEGMRARGVTGPPPAPQPVQPAETVESDPIDALINQGRFQTKQPTSNIDYAKIDAMQMPNTDTQMEDLAAQYPNLSPEDLQAYMKDKKAREARSAIFYMNNPVKPPITAPTTHKAFVNSMFDEFSDIFHKADPHTVGMIIANMYLTR